MCYNSYMKFEDTLSEEKIISSFLMEMANIPTAQSGLSYMIWLGEVGGQHRPRIKVSNIKGKSPKTDSFVVTVSKQPKILTPKYCKIPKKDVEDIFDWIVLNYDDLMSIYGMFEDDVGNPFDVILNLKKL